MADENIVDPATVTDPVAILDPVADEPAVVADPVDPVSVDPFPGDTPSLDDRLTGLESKVAEIASHIANTHATTGETLAALHESVLAINAELKSIVASGGAGSRFLESDERRNKWVDAVLYKYFGSEYPA